MKKQVKSKSARIVLVNGQHAAPALSCIMVCTNNSPVGCCWAAACVAAALQCMAAAGMVADVRMAVIFLLFQILDLRPDLKT